MQKMQNMHMNTLAKLNSLGDTIFTSKSGENDRWTVRVLALFIFTCTLKWLLHHEVVLVTVALVTCFVVDAD